MQYLASLPGATTTDEATAARFAKSAHDLIAANVDLIVAMGTRGSIAAMAATSTIPIVFLADQPVENGLVASLSRAGGNATGVSYHANLLSTKRLQLLKQAVPKIRRVGYLAPSGAAAPAEYRAIQAAAMALEVEMSLVLVDNTEDLERAFTSAPQVEAWIIENWAMFAPQMDRINKLVASLHKPAMYGDRKKGVLPQANEVLE